MKLAVEQTSYSISDLAHEFGITPRAIRFYEDKGLLSPARKGQTRVYCYRDRVRLQLILKGKRVGFSLTDIKSMLDLYDPDNEKGRQLTYTLEKMRNRISQLKQQRIDIEETIEELEKGCDALDLMLAGGSPELKPLLSF